MLSDEENDLLCRVGPGTPMGKLMREYWFPALPSKDLPERDGQPKRMRLLGENLVMYRDTAGRVGAYPDACPHRGASLYFGRNEECGLRCNYHGWKFDVEGNCVDVPTETSPQFKERIRIRNYPCRDVNHVIWIYMGPRQTPPIFPGYEVNTLPPSHVREPMMMMYEANWLQNMEGDIDSAHLDYLHTRLRVDSPDPPVGQPGFWNPDPDPSRLDVRMTPYGGYYTTIRSTPEGMDWHRITHFLLPFYTMVTAPWARLRAWVPMDDYHTLVFSQMADPVSPFPPERLANTPEEEFAEVGGWVDRTTDNDPSKYYLTYANQTNDYLLNYNIQQTLMSSGIPFVLNLQDRAMTELMRAGDGAPLYDRTQEHLCRTDLMVVAVRRQLVELVRAHEETGAVPANVDDDELNLVRPVTRILPKGADWDALTVEDRKVHPGRPVVMERGTMQDKDGNSTDVAFMRKDLAGTYVYKPAVGRSKND